MAVLNLTLNFVGMLLVVLVVPVVIIVAHRRAVRMPAVREFVQTPVLSILTISGGGVLGVVLTYLAATPELVAAKQIFASPGPWDITFIEFLRNRVNPLAFDYAAAIRVIGAGGMFDILNLLLVFVAGTLAAAILICNRVWYLREALLASVLCLLIVLSSAYIVIYVVAGFIWLLNHLNFLIFIVPILIVRNYALLFRSIP